MKLLYCRWCDDVFKLGFKLKTCECGKVKGKYMPDGIHAEVTSNAISVAIGNGALTKAIVDATLNKDGDRASYHELSKGLISFAWVRPNEGPGNPHSKVNDDL